MSGDPDTGGAVAGRTCGSHTWVMQTQGSLTPRPLITPFLGGPGSLDNGGWGAQGCLQPLWALSSGSGKQGTNPGGKPLPPVCLPCHPLDRTEGLGGRDIRGLLILFSCCTLVDPKVIWGHVAGSCCLKEPHTQFRLFSKALSPSTKGFDGLCSVPGACGLQADSSKKNQRQQVLKF